MKDQEIRNWLEEREKGLAPFATKSKNSFRKFPEKEDPFRTSFQRDRDRIIYSSSFRRLQYKTQVFLVHEADFYRTRLTHTLEVMQHARTLARALKANEDLVEAISLAHDLGHPPFGHAGEDALNDLMREWGGFNHNLQGLRIVDELEHRYPNFPGLNLTYHTREGIARHCTAYDKSPLIEEFSDSPQPGVETQIVSIADELAFCAHDLDDGLRVGLINEEILEESGNTLWKEIIQRAKKETESQEKEFLYRRAVRHLIEICNTEVINYTSRRLKELDITSDGEVRRMSEPLVSLPPETSHELKHLREMLEKGIYYHPDVVMMTEKGRNIVKKLFHAFLNTPRLLPHQFQEKLSKSEDNKARVVCDYIAGMTDRFAMDTYEMLFHPHVRVLSRIGRKG